MAERKEGEFAYTPAELARRMVNFTGNTEQYEHTWDAAHGRTSLKDGKFQFIGSEEELSEASEVFARNVNDAIYKAYWGEHPAHRSEKAAAKAGRVNALKDTQFSTLLLLTATNDPSLRDRKVGITDDEIRSALSDGALAREMEMRQAVNARDGVSLKPPIGKEVTDELSKIRSDERGSDYLIPVQTYLQQRDYVSPNEKRLRRRYDYLTEQSVPDLQKNIAALQDFQQKLTEKMPSDPSSGRRR